MRDPGPESRSVDWFCLMVNPIARGSPVPDLRFAASGKTMERYGGDGKHGLTCDSALLQACLRLLSYPICAAPRMMAKQAFFSFVMAGLVPAICKPLNSIDPRHKAEDDDGRGVAWQKRMAFRGKNSVLLLADKKGLMPVQAEGDMTLIASALRCRWRVDLWKTADFRPNIGCLLLLRMLKGALFWWQRI